ncbi:MAG: bifunctional glycoside hydrolase 114/ polysaccharide deacetylase family protein [Synoicihabitans sp.]
MRRGAIFIGLIFAPLVALASGSFYVNYDALVPDAPLRLNPYSIVHPDAAVNLAAAHTEGNRVLAYLSVGEIAADAPYRQQAEERALRLRGRNEIWRSDIIDLSDERWLDLIVGDLAKTAHARGFDGFFLDTVDSIAAEDREQGIRLIKRLREDFPDSTIVANRGFGLVPALRDTIDGVLVESVFGTFDFTTQVYRPVPAEETAILRDRLEEVEQLGLEAWVLDYADPADPDRAFEIATKIKDEGWHAFVSTPELRGAALAPWREIPRRIFSFYGNLATETIDQILWPMDSFTALRLQTPLEWLGYEVDYGKVVIGQPMPTLQQDVAAIVLPKGWEIPLSEEARAVDWLIEQHRMGRRILIFGGLPFADDRHRVRLMKALGMGGDGSIILPVTDLKLAVADQAVLAGAEVKTRLLATDFANLTAPSGSRVIKSISARDGAGKAVQTDAIFVSEWGGMAADPYLIFQRPDFRELWQFDIFEYLKLALGRVEGPLPDATTRQGRRMFLSHIDGDGFVNKSQTSIGQYSSEVVRDEILKKYPLPITVSIIEAEVKVDMMGVDPALRPKFEEIARDIFRLPNVELASHSYSHPFIWIPNDRTAYLYDRKNLALRVPYPEINLTREIKGSVDYINQELAPPGKKVEVFLWSGNCRPPPEALQIVLEQGLVAMNGGDTLISRRVPTVNAVAPRSIPWGDQLQVLAPAQNENVYTNDWEGPLFGTFINVIETFERTESPRRFKPVNIYYHFYSADFFSSLRALRMIHEWAMEQDLHAVKVSDYVLMAKDVRRTRLYSDGSGRWAVVNQGQTPSLRIPAELANRIDSATSQGVMGWVEHQGKTYLHPDGSPVTIVALAPEGDEPGRVPRLESSTGNLTFAERMAGRVSFRVEDLKEVKVVLAGLPSHQSIAVDRDGVSQTVETDVEGRLRLTLPKVADVRLSWD